MAETKNIYQRLSAVQNELKVPKSQKNTFGGYSYRSAEDILEAVKPVLAKHELVLIITDTLEAIGDRYYVKAEAAVHDLDGGEKYMYAHGYAREEEAKKGMDASQITGAASSYARKYALNGLFNIDDTKDADTDAHHKVTHQEERKPAAAPKAPVKETTQDVLARAKSKINEDLEVEGYDTPEAKQRFINSVLKKVTIDSLDDADLVMDAIENNRGAA